MPQIENQKALMFKSLKRITYKASDLAGAKKWYMDVLNVQPLFDTPFAIIFKVGDCTLSLSKANGPTQNGAEGIETYWEVEDIDASYQKLIELGAKVHTPIKDVLNIRIAKVIDPFGNVVGISGYPKDVKERTVENKPSETAIMVAFCRALAAKDDREGITGPDSLAEIFLTDEGRKPLFDRAARKWAIQNLITSSLYGYLISRTAFMDYYFKKALDEDIPQIVLLGAGYDTRAYRFGRFIANTRIYELDVQSTQTRKVDILNNCKVEIPPQVSFVTINFKNERLEDVLGKSGFDKTAKTLFIWEGVTYYLPQEAIMGTLSFIKDFSPAGSIVCFDYLTEKIGPVNLAEPFLFWVGQDGLNTILSNLGFGIVEHIVPSEMVKRYLTLKDGAQAEQVFPYFNFVAGEVS